ncbi:hypothetical protein GS931_21385 [Rhodococcus hoagii]|nr:hypothetical protein [Prescottella equi]
MSDYGRARIADFPQCGTILSMTDADLVPYVAVAVAEGLPVQEAWGLVRDLADSNLGPEAFTIEIHEAAEAYHFPGGLRSV